MSHPMNLPPVQAPPEGVFPRLEPGTKPVAPEPYVVSRTLEGYKYELQVVQQPIRARMCGFGDKDRRPITPPPCIRLVITEITSGREVDVNDINHGMFILNVDLWDKEGQKEVNLVRHSAQSPSIGTAVPVSYGDVSQPHYVPTGALAQHFPQTAPYNPYPNQGPPTVTPYGQSQHPTYGNMQHRPQYSGAPQPGHYATYAAPPNNGYQPAQQPPPQQYQHPHQQNFYTGASIHTMGGRTTIPASIGNVTIPPEMRVEALPGDRVPGPYVVNLKREHVGNTNSPPVGMFTRNLIGSLAASAFRLSDPDDRIGIWFVLQDLSVRTEGEFRLRFSFVNVGVPVGNNPASMSTNRDGSTLTPGVNTGRAPVLAACFSDAFTVYSAKKFPGVVESTPLSKCFATQGIKIPIRKEGAAGKGKQGDEYDED